MKELRVQISIKNNRLVERREALGLSQGELAAAAGIHKTVYGGLETMRTSPLNEHGELRPSARKLCDFHCATAKELFPPSVLKVERNSAIIKVDAEELGQLTSSWHELALAGPEEALEQAEEAKRKTVLVEEALKSLPTRVEQILRWRHGVGCEPMTLAEVGEKLGVCRERVRILEQGGLRTLRWYDQKRDFALSELTGDADRLREENRKWLARRNAYDLDYVLEQHKKASVASREDTSPIT
jgi:transcriptional regulator with XRE-family HTH domain